MLVSIQKEFPSVSVASINGVNQESVNARELYLFLSESGKSPSKWWNSAIQNYDFVEGVDFDKRHPSASAAILRSSRVLGDIQVSMVMAEAKSHTGAKRI